MLAQLVEHCTSITEVNWVQILYRPEFFSGLIFTTAQVVFIIAKITFIFTSLSTVHIYNFHTFTVVDSSLHGFIWNQHIDQLPVGSLAQLVKHCTGITEVVGSNPVQDLSSVSLQQRSLPYSFLDNLLFMYMNSIYSQSFKTNFLSHGLIIDFAVRILKRNQMEMEICRLKIALIADS